MFQLLLRNSCCPLPRKEGNPHFICRKRVLMAIQKMKVTTPSACTRFDILLRLWAVTALCAAVSHIVLPGWTAAGTTWAMSLHWQREIAFFDLFIAFIFGWAARQPDLHTKRNVTLLLCGLSLLLGENHLEGWLAAPKVFHVLFTLANGLAVLWGVLACWSVHALVPPPWQDNVPARQQRP